jgi:hypothetical protein
MPDWMDGSGPGNEVTMGRDQQPQRPHLLVT